MTLRRIHRPFVDKDDNVILSKLNCTIDWVSHAEPTIGFWDEAGLNMFDMRSILMAEGGYRAGNDSAIIVDCVILTSIQHQLFKGSETRLPPNC